MAVNNNGGWVNFWDPYLGPMGSIPVAEGEPQDPGGTAAAWQEAVRQMERTIQYIQENPLEVDPVSRQQALQKAQQLKASLQAMAQLAEQNAITLSQYLAAIRLASDLRTLLAGWQVAAALMASLIIMATIDLASRTYKVWSSCGWAGMGHLIKAVDAVTSGDTDRTHQEMAALEGCYNDGAAPRNAPGKARLREAEQVLTGHTRTSDSVWVSKEYFPDNNSDNGEGAPDWMSGGGSGGGSGSSGGDAISLRADNGDYVCAEGGGGAEVNANRGGVGPWEVWHRVDLGGGNVALRADNGQHLCAENGGGSVVVANRGSIGAWETFHEHDLGGGNVAYETADGHYLCAEGGGGGALVADRTSAGAWETFHKDGA